MPPVKTAASSTDVDNEATAELPVLDVAAYEAALGDNNTSSTDTWSVPPGTVAAMVAQVEVAPLPSSADVIPTLRAADPAELADLSGTHEMPVIPSGNKVIKATPVNVPAPAALATRNVPPPATITLPPSPPLIEELRGALAAAERRIEELNERARIADADRAVASARAAAENAQLREQLGLRQETLHSSAARLGVQRADQAELEDELFARADRIEALQREMAAQGEVLARIRKLQMREQRHREDHVEVVRRHAGKVEGVFFAGVWREVVVVGGGHRVEREVRERLGEVARGPVDAFRPDVQPQVRPAPVDVA